MNYRRKELIFRKMKSPSSFKLDAIDYSINRILTLITSNGNSLNVNRYWLQRVQYYEVEVSYVLTRDDLFSGDVTYSPRGRGIRLPEILSLYEFTKRNKVSSSLKRKHLVAIIDRRKPSVYIIDGKHKIIFSIDNSPGPIYRF